MGEISPSRIILLSKRQLGVTSDSAVPKFYKDELRSHLQEFPDDYNFHVQLEPGLGFGKAICKEQGCNGVSIPLSRRISAQDHGLKDGCGSLASYGMHVLRHPTHMRERQARVKAEKQEAIIHSAISSPHTSPTRIKQEPNKSTILDLLDSTENPVTKASSRNIKQQSAPSSPIKRVSSLLRVNSKDSKNGVIPKKRLSDSALQRREFGDNLSTASNGTGSFKRLKMEPSLEEIPMNMSTESIDDTRSKLREVYTSIASAQTAIDRVNRKPKRTKSDVTKLARLSVTLENLRKKREELNALLPSMSSSKRGGLIKHPSFDVSDLETTLPSVRIRSVEERKPFASPFRRPVTPGNGSVGARVEEEGKPFTSPFNRPVTPGNGPRTPLAATSSQSSRVKREEATVPSGALSAQIKRGIPSSSLKSQEQLVKPKPEPEPLPFIAAKLPSFPDRHRSHATDDDEMMLDYDQLGRVDPALAANILNRIGINVPPPLPNAENFDNNGDFFGRGRDTFAGPQAKADDIDKFLIEAGNAEAFDGNARVDQALEKLGLENQYELLPGMEVALMPHQTIGVAWMADKEASTFKGGCLADDMGLGKTVQMIALMLKNRSEDPLCKTNLIIAPTALLDQWKLEIEMKTNADLKCLIYHGQSKPKKKSDILKYDIVLTTYMTMSLEWPDFETQMKKRQQARTSRRKPKDDFIASDSDEESDNYNRPKRGVRKERGLLFKIDFYRIILDEAQSIRNRRTRTSRAVTELNSIYRWCLTGTPIVNGLGDAYGYIRFLKVRPWYDVTQFQGHIGILEKKNPGLAVSRLQTVLNSFQLRRKKDTEMDGKRLIELPEKNIDLIKLEFSTEERDIYSMIETKTQERFNRFLRAGTVLKNYHQVLVLLLRLRQICSHPCLIQEGGGAFIAPHEVVETDAKGAEVATELSRARRLVSAEFVAKLQAKFKEAALARLRAEKESFDAFVDDEECPICYDNFNNPIVTPCSHIFCRTCLVEHIRNAPPVDPTPGETHYKANERPCPICKSPVAEDTMFDRSAFEPTDEELAGNKPTKVAVVKDIEIIDVDDSSDDEKCKGKRKSPARPKRNVRQRNVVKISDNDEGDEDEDDDISDFIVESDEDEEEKDARRALKKRVGARRRNNIVLDSDDDFDDAAAEEVVFGRKKKEPIPEEVLKTMPRFLPSTKMKFMMEKLTELFQEKPDEKVLVISQWTSCLSLVSDYLSEKGIIHVKYQGNMNRSKRDNAIRIFMSKDKAKVMLMSLKCGGVGLNLTRANNVISLDLGWSQAVEAQAFDRVHRLGQQRAVNVKRLVISGTVEDRVLSLQERKQTLADGSLGEGTGKKIGKLTVKELANLFGLDARGRRLDDADR
ncbi:SNF2 family N-terminal domain-containing protein [Cyathus striatus]|nr:SNF2 family N-terminal domain-containing protein [Cyathus striatus]